MVILIVRYFAQKLYVQRDFKKKSVVKNSMGSEKLPLLFYSYVLVNSHICLRKKEIHQTFVVFKMLANH